MAERGRVVVVGGGITGCSVAYHVAWSGGPTSSCWSKRWTRPNWPPWFSRVAAEHAAFRERVGIIDMTSFGKLEVSGPGAVALLERVCDSRIDRPPGTIVYTQFLNARGGIVADVTVTRLTDYRFRVITGAATMASDRGWPS